MEIGSIADWVSGIGTLFAVGVSLYLSSSRDKIDVNVKMQGLLEPVSILHDENIERVVTYKITNFSKYNLKITFFGFKINVKRNYLRRKSNWRAEKLFFFKPKNIVPRGHEIPFNVGSQSATEIAFNIERVYKDIHVSGSKDEDNIMIYCKDNFGNEYYGDSVALSKLKIKEK